MYFIIGKTIYGNPVKGFPTLVVFNFIFWEVFQLLSLGIIGEYLGKVFYETKNRPLYFTKHTMGSQELMNSRL